MLHLNRVAARVRARRRSPTGATDINRLRLFSATPGRWSPRRALDRRRYRAPAVPAARARARRRGPLQRRHEAQPPLPGRVCSARAWRSRPTVPRSSSRCSWRRRRPGDCCSRCVRIGPWRARGISRGGRRGRGDRRGADGTGATATLGAGFSRVAGRLTKAMRRFFNSTGIGCIGQAARHRARLAIRIDERHARLTSVDMPLQQLAEMIGRDPSK